MLIRLFGTYWNPDNVNWGKQGRNGRGQLLGKVKTQGSKKKRVVDFWDVRGIYALYDDFKLVYIGQTVTGKAGVLGKRLRDHLTDRFGGRWDMFSWFALSSLREKKVRDPGTRQVTPGDVVNTLEAFGIHISTPPLNRRYNQIPGAIEAEQEGAKTPHTIRHYLEQILDEVRTTEEDGEE